MQDDNSVLTRRALFGGLAVAALAEGCSSRGGGSGGGVEDASTDGTVVGDGSAAADAGPDPDIAQLNGLLDVELRLLATCDAARSDIRQASNADPQAAFGLVLDTVLAQWLTHHRAHAAALGAAVSALGGTPRMVATTQYAPPPGYTASINDALRLVANAERAAAVAYNEGVERLRAATSRALVANIEADETQHFATLYALLQGALAPGMALITGGVTDIVPAAFVTAVGGASSLQMVPDLPYL